MYTILICDDEPDIRAALRIYLTGEGYRVLEAENGERALELLREDEVQLVLMDIMMPGLDGMTATARLRETSNVPVILITAKSEDSDKILGLTVGADDYVTKPFNPLEVLARVRAQLRRYATLGGMAAKNTDLSCGGVAMDDEAKRVTLHGEEVSLTPTEYDILRLLLRNPGKVFSAREIYDIPAVESGYDLNVEQILALKPQVVLMSTMAQSKEQIEALEAAGIQVVVSDAQDIAGVYTSIEMIGKLMGKDAEAAAVIEDMKNKFADIAAKATGDGSKSIYVEVSELQYGLWAAGKGTFYQEVIEMLGLKNAFEDVDLYASISEEQVLERNPDYILTISMYFGEGPTPVEEILGRKGWENVTAVKNAAILNLPNNELSRPAPRLADGAQMLFDFIYGEAEENAA